MKHIYYIILSFVLAVATAAEASEPTDRTLNYNARYHCGFIKITAGTAVIHYRIDGDRLFATMNGNSVPIGRRIYAISDTLCATMTPAANGLSREKVTYENAWYTKPYSEHAVKDIFDFRYPESYCSIKGQGDLDASNETMEAITISADMLAMFYHFRQIDYESMSPGQTAELTIDLPDGDTQQLSIVYEGADTFEGRDTHRLTFTYSYHGTMTDYPVTAQIDSVTGDALLLAADIKIGHIELLLDS